ncbi:contractile injection system tape measure protein, partial [Nitrosomonas oligotropha]|uniref:contractile injection system tape measure protein n=1 Tax=Nitrosomonas oligotropha TaxID=42354 RepID=UPI0019603E05
AYLLAPQVAVLNEHLLAQTDKLCRVTGLAGQSNRQQWQQRLWAASLRYLLTLNTAEITPTAYLRALARNVSDETDAQITLRAWHEALAGIKTAAAIRLLLQAVIETPVESLHSEKENPLVKTGTNPSLPLEQAAAIDWDALLNRAESTGVTEEIYIENAGQVLAAPYLSRLFSVLKLVEEGAFVDRQAAERAVHLLQFMVNEQTQSPEFQLTLNKILCGVSTGIPICREITISVQEQETIEGLIRGMIQNWTTIGNTSISGLRETFLRRKGKLQLKEDGMWYLTVEPGVFDMLLDSLPWSFSVIKHSWMERAVHVTWR